MLSEDLESAIADLVAIGEAEAGADPRTLEDLVVMHARDLTGLDTLSSLRTLSLIGSSVGDYGLIGRLPSLTMLAIENSDVTSLAGVLPDGIHVAIVRGCRVSSVGDLEGLAGLQVLDVSGNPLAAAAAAAVDGVAARGVAAPRDGARILSRNARLDRNAAGFVCAGTDEACTLTISGLDITPSPERVRVATTADQVEAALSAGTLRALAGID